MLGPDDRPALCGLGGGAALGAQGEGLPQQLLHGGHRHHQPLHNLLFLPPPSRDQPRPLHCNQVQSLFLYHVLLNRRNVISLVEGSAHKTCDQGWIYDHGSVFNTITTEVRLSQFFDRYNNTSQSDWVCEEDYKPMLIHTVFWIGNTIGCFIWGFTNDL